MAIYKVQGPDGKIIQIEGPDGASDEEILSQAQKLSAAPAPAAKAESSMPQWMSDALKYGPGFLAEQGKNAVRGAGTMAAQGLSQLAKLSPMVPNKLADAVGNAGAREVRNALPVDPNETPAQKRMRDVSEGAGGAVFGAPTMATLPAAAAAGAMGGLGSNVGGEFARKSGLPQGLGEVLGGLVGGVGTAFALGPRQTPAHAEIRDAAQGANWDKVNANAADLIGSGAKTATAAEAFPQGSGVRDLANRTRAGTSSNALKLRMEDRGEDLSNLGKEYLNRIGPAVEGNVIAERAAQAANAIEENLAKLKNEGFRNRLGNEAIRPDLVKKFEDALLAAAEAEQRGGPKGAYREIAGALRNPDTGELITRTSELSKVLYGFQQGMKNGSLLGRSGNMIQANDMGIPLKNAKQGLEELSPNFEAANVEARAFNQGGMNPGPRGEFAQSQLKKLADRNPAVIDPTPVNRLEALTSGTSEQQIAKLLASLERDPGLSPGQGVGPLEITQAISQQRLKGAPTNPGAAIRQEQGSSMEGQIAQMLASGGKDPKQVMQPLRAADLMQDAATQGGMNSMPKIQPLQWLIRTLRSADMTVTGKGLEKMDQEIARLLADPVNLAEIQKIAAFDPTIRRQLMLRAPMLGLSGNQGGQ